MTRFDDISITCPFNPDTMDVNLFSTTATRNDEVLQALLPVDKGYRNDMKLLYSRYAKGTDHGELRVFVTSKLLLDDYKLKIGADNIEKCLEVVLKETDKNIFSSKELIEKGSVNRLQVTEDVLMSVNKDDCRVIDSLLFKPNQWHTIDRSKNSYGWNSKLSGEVGKHAFKMYNKGIQMNNSKRRRQFMESNSIPKDSFDGTLRLELRLESPSLVRRGLGIRNNTLKSVFSSDVNPVVSFIEKNFDLSDKGGIDSSIRNLNDLEMIALIEKYKKNWPVIEREIRKLTKTNASKKLREYREKYQLLMANQVSGNSGAAMLTRIIELVNDNYEQPILSAA